MFVILTIAQNHVYDINMNTNQIYIDFGKQLRDLRKQARLSQADLAERVGLSRTSVTNIERGRQHLPLHMVFLLADAVGVDPTKLIPETTHEPAHMPNHVMKRLSRERGLEGGTKAWIGKVITSAMTKGEVNEIDGEES